MHVVIAGGGAALAQPVIQHYLDQGSKVTAVCRVTTPAIQSDRLAVTTESLYPEGKYCQLLVTLLGKTADSRLAGMTDDDWRVVIERNLNGAFAALHYAAGWMVNGGNIVVVGSIIGSTGGYGCANYAAAKAGLVGLVRAAANELADRNICVNLLELGFVNCGLGASLKPEVKERARACIPLRRFAEPAEVVEAIAFLSAVRYMTGNTLTLAGGLR